MNFRKLFGIPSKQQKVLIDSDTESIKKKCAVIANNEWNEQKEQKKFSDSFCPKCHEKEIVNKVRQVIGIGKFEGSILFGFGHLHGATTIETLEVNSCVKCGNEWKKFKTKYVAETDILRVALKYLVQINENSSEKKHTWKMETISIFDDCYAETIHTLMYVNKPYIPKVLSLFTLRKQYKSIYN